MINRFLLVVAFGTFLGLAPHAVAQSTDEADALSQTQKLLLDPNLRNAAVKQDGKAKALDARVHELGGSEQNSDKIYGAASKALEDVFKQTKGDPNKMAELIEKAKSDPEGFAKSLSPETRAQIKDASQSISNDRAPAATRK